jgi:hypothetical protein
MAEKKPKPRPIKGIGSVIVGEITVPIFVDDKIKEHGYYSDDPAPHIKIKPQFDKYYAGKLVLHEALHCMSEERNNPKLVKMIQS